MASGIRWLASYPKSGNTWLRAVVSTLASGQPVDINAMGFLGASADSRCAFEHALGIDSANLSPAQETNLRPRAYEIWAAEAGRTLYCKTHDACHSTPAGEPLFPAAVTRGAVYVVRDPRAVAVSLAHYLDLPIDAAIAVMDDPAATLASSTKRYSQHLGILLRRWSDHVESWLGARFPVHLMRYEDMLAHPRPAFAALAAFLDLPCDPATIAAAVDATVFSRLQAQEYDAGFVEKPRTARVFFREGKRDGWRRSLTPDQAARIVAAHGPMMRRLGYDVALAPFRPARGAA
jgi:hypothetical protein